MSFFSRLAFWKHPEPGYGEALGPGPELGLPPLPKEPDFGFPPGETPGVPPSIPTMPSFPSESATAPSSFESKQTFGYTAPMAPPAYGQMPAHQMQPMQSQPASATSKDVEIVSLKMDNVRQQLDMVNQRLDRIERLLERRY
jgi:hypothetical protein